MLEVVWAQRDQPGQPGAVPRRQRDLSEKRDADNNADPHPQSPACQTLQLSYLCQAFKPFSAELEMFVARGRFALKTSLSPAPFCWWDPRFTQIVFPPPRLEKPCSQGCSRSREGGCVPGTHWNWNKAQPLESLHSPVHRLFYRCPVFGRHQTLVFIFIFFFFSPLQ